MLSRVPVDSDLLKRSVRNGASTLMLCLSDRQCLFGSWHTAMMMSSSDSSSKRCSEQAGGATVNVGGSALLVDAQTPSTLSSKKWWKSEALTPAREGMGPPPIRLSIDCHRLYGLDFSLSTFAVQNDSRFSRSRSRYA